MRLKGLIKLNPKEKLVVKLDQFKTERDLESRRQELRKMEWNFVDLLVQRVMSHPGCSPKQMLGLPLEEAVELANYVADKCEADLKILKSFWRRFVTRKSTDRGEIKFIMLYLTYYRNLKDGYGKDFFPYPKFQLYLKEMIGYA